MLQEPLGAALKHSSAMEAVRSRNPKKPVNSNGWKSFPFWVVERFTADLEQSLPHAIEKGILSDSITAFRDAYGHDAGGWNDTHARHRSARPKP